jgi:hypothetical protein
MPPNTASSPPAAKSGGSRLMLIVMWIIAQASLSGHDGTSCEEPLMPPVVAPRKMKMWPQPPHP